MTRLSKIATSQPHTAYAVLTHCLLSKWTYLLRTVPDVSKLLHPVEEAIRHSFLPALTGRTGLNDMERNLLELPVRLGGLGMMTFPIEEHNFALPKSSFRDAHCLHYGLIPPHLPAHCVCGSTFSTEHALSCPCGGLPSIRHNNIRDFTAKLRTEVCPNVEIEPALQPLTGERFTSRTAISVDEARDDVRAQGFWGDRGQCANIKHWKVLEGFRVTRLLGHGPQLVRGLCPVHVLGGCWRTCCLEHT